MSKSGPFKCDDERDPSFGVVSISRVQGQRRLFDSPFEHHHFITLSIRRAYRTRTNLHSDYIGDGEELIEVAMSEVQFANMITSLNVGGGTPCTIARWDGECVKEPAPEQTKKIFENEAAEHFTDLAAMAAELEKLTAMPAKDVKAPQRERMAFLALKVHQAVSSSATFFHEQFQRSMDKTVAAAKGEVQAYIMAAISKAGLKALNGKEPFRIELDETGKA